jgi:NADH:ubiquinone oxidoreductase subunit 6 (subunit J)
MTGFGVSVAFWVLSVLTLASAGGVMASRNLIHAVLFLIVVFLGVSGFFVLLSADFLAMAQVIIYVGAISVLILFAIVLTPRAERDNSETVMVLPAIFLGISLMAIMLFVLYDANWSVTATEPSLSAAVLGSSLLSVWVLPFELASVLLTAALVGSIMLVRSPSDEEGDLA